MFIFENFETPTSIYTSGRFHTKLSSFLVKEAGVVYILRPLQMDPEQQREITASFTNLECRVLSLQQALTYLDNERAKLLFSKNTSTSKIMESLIAARL